MSSVPSCSPSVSRVGPGELTTYGAGTTASTANSTAATSMAIESVIERAPGGATVSSGSGAPMPNGSISRVAGVVSSTPRSSPTAGPGLAPDRRSPDQRDRGTGRAERCGVPRTDAPARERDATLDTLEQDVEALGARPLRLPARGEQATGVDGPRVHGVR